MVLAEVLTDWVATEQDAGGKYVVLVVLVKVLADDEGRSHVEQTGADSIQQAVCEEHPLERADERRA